ncbi:MAG TPA: response regulator transcription factor [Acidimicrobiia bacterium]|nr:response regulator transcription factor [Acidimicrobiia bacterium]
MPRISVLLATPDQAFFDRIAGCVLARPEVRLIGRAVGDGRVVAAVQRERPDVLLVDGASYGARGLRFIQRVAALDLSTRSLLLHSDPTEVRLTHVLQSGGGGCLPILCSAYDLIRAVQAVHAGELWASRRALADVLRDLRVPLGSNAHNASEPTLSRREREIVAWMRKGMTNKEIARVLGISDMTVKTHAHNIFHKLEVCGRRVLGSVPLLEH